MAEMTDISGVIIKETGAAILIDTGEEEPFWIPKSLIEYPQDEWPEGEEVEISIPLWFADKEGIV